MLVSVKEKQSPVDWYGTGQQNSFALQVLAVGPMQSVEKGFVAHLF